jgi:hypothetical protein
MALWVSFCRIGVGRCLAVRERAGSLSSRSFLDEPRSLASVVCGNHDSSRVLKSEHNSNCKCLRHSGLI